MAARIRKGDTVLVITGADKGRRGEVLRVFPKADRAMVQACTWCASTASRRAWASRAGSASEEASIHLSNLKLIDPKSEKPTKVGFRVLDDGRKVRVAKATGQVIEG